MIVTKVGRMEMMGEHRGRVAIKLQVVKTSQDDSAEPLFKVSERDSSATIVPNAGTRALNDRYS
jgi:hypothetical protein